MNKQLTIAVDFDGTIVEHKYPAIGNEIPFATHTLKVLQSKGHRLILWTYRVGDELNEALEFCQQKGLEFYAVNKNYPEEKFNAQISRKILADIYIDDRNIGGMLSWTEIYQLIHPEDSSSQVQQNKEKSKWNWFK